MRHHRLIPALEIIEDSLFNTLEQAAQAWDDPGPFGAVDDAPLPALIADVVARRAAASPLPQAREPSPGQIWWIALDPGADRPVAMVLVQLTPPEAQGWLVGCEVAYAGADDWVLQDDDVHGALDPRLGMVQLWHRVRVPAERLDAIAAVLHDTVFEALHTVAGQSSALADVAPSPGRVGLTERHGVCFVCGTPLGDPQRDPRHAYRALYRKLARQLQPAPPDDTEEQEP